MVEKIQLKVPARPEAEFVSQGNFSAELAPNGIVETENRRFADYLIKEYRLTEVVAQGDDAGDEKKSDFETQYPADFPRREVFIEREIPFATARNLTREQLIAISGIAEKTAERILAWQPENSNDGGEL